MYVCISIPAPPKEWSLIKKLDDSFLLFNRTTPTAEIIKWELQSF